MARLLMLLVAVVAHQTIADHHEGHYGKKVGEFRNLHHGIGGVVYATGEHSLLIKDFEYDGAGPDAFFWVGTDGKPSAVGTILPHPFQGKFFEYEDQSAPILTGRFDKVDIKLTLPDDLKVTELKWISVWCRAFKVNFGDMFFPEDLDLEAADAEAEGEAEGEAESESEPEDEAEEESESEVEAESESDYKHNKDKDGLPPPLVAPSNAHDPNHRHHDDDPDAESQAEGESESESEPEYAKKGAAGALHPSVLLSLFLALIASRW